MKKARTEVVEKRSRSGKVISRGQTKGRPGSTAAGRAKDMLVVHGKVGDVVGKRFVITAEAEITPKGRIASARRVFSSDAEVANALGVARSQLSRWKAGQSPDDTNREKLVGLDAVVELLTGFLNESTIQKWLNSPNAHLGNRRPLTLLRANRLSELIAAIEAEKSGAFA